MTAFVPAIRPLKYFGVRYDNSSSRTLAKNNIALQAMADWATTEVTANKHPQVIVEPREICFSTTIVFHGTQGGSLSLTSQIPSGGHPFDVPAARFTWHGANDGTMFFYEQMNKALIDGIELNGNNVAGILLNLSATKYGDPTTLKATSSVRVRSSRFCFVRPGVDGNVCVSLGTDPALTGGNTYQQSEVSFQNCDFIGESPGAPGFDWSNLKAACWRTQSGGNCKNFSLMDCQFAFARYAVDWAASSGDLFISNLNNADCQTMLRQHDSQSVVMGGDNETGDTPDFKLLEGSGGGGITSCTLDGLQAFVFLEGSTGLMIDWGGQLQISGCTLSNMNTSVHGGIVGNPWNMHVTSGVRSFGNAFMCANGNASPAGTYAKFVDGSNNPYAPIPGSSFYTYGGPSPVTSQADKFTTDLSSGGLAYCKDFSSQDVGPRKLYTKQGINLALPGTTSGGNASLIVDEGRVGRAWFRYTYPYTAFQTSITTADLQIGTFQQNQRIYQMRANVTTPFAGTAGTLNLRAGYNVTGDDRIFQDKDVKTAAVIIGDDPADLNSGAGGLGTAAALHSGLNPGPSAQWTLALRLTSGSGALSGLNAGSVTFEIEMELL